MNRIIIITGTRKGIGKYLVHHFLDQGDFVYGCSRRDFLIENDQYLHFRLDISNEKDVKEMVRTIIKKHSRIDILINNAGIASMNHSFLTPVSTVQRVFSTNLIGTFLFCREVGKIMVKNQKGRIINFSTVAVPLNLEGESIYSSSKAAIEQLTKVLAAELGRSNVTVNAIGPSPIQTDLIANVPKSKINDLIQKQSIKRVGTFSDIKNVIDFFIDDKSDFINGQIIYLGGIN